MDDSVVVPLEDIKVDDCLNYIERLVENFRLEGKNLEEQGCCNIPEYQE